MAEIFNTSVFSSTDANNNTGTVPTWAEGMAPSQVNDSARALQGALTREWNWRNYVLTSTGSSNAYVLTHTVAPASLGTGQRYAWKASFANTGAATLNINSLGAKTIKKLVAGAKTDLASGDLPSGSYVEVAYDGTDFVWVNQPADFTNVAMKNATNTFTFQQNIILDDAVNNNVTTVAKFSHTTSGTASAGIGARLAFGIENGSGTEVTPLYDALLTTVTAGAESSKFRWVNYVGGVLQVTANLGGGYYSEGVTGGDKGVGTINAATYYKSNTDLFPASGSFTPTVAFGGASVGITYGARSGVYQQVGPNLAFLNVDVTLTNKGSSTGAMTIGGIPFTVTNNSVAPTFFVNMSASAPNIGIAVGTSITIYRGDGASSNMVACSEANATNTTRILWSGLVTI